MRLKFLGAAETVTGSKYLLEVGDKRILVDCGLFQGKKELRLQNWEPFAEDPRTIDAVVLTHAHIDHSGYLPLFVKQGFKGPIYATSATFDLCDILLRDAARIQEDDARRANRYGYSKHKQALPLYTEEDAISALKLFQVIDFGKEYSIGSLCTFHARYAGHILGASIMTFKGDGVTLVFSGDLGRANDFIMRAPDTIYNADYLVLESTYGNRLHPKTDPEAELEAIIRETAKNGGTILIPSFAVGRAQTILYLLYQLKTAHRIPDIPIYLDSPMAIDATGIMCKHNKEHKLSKELAADVCHIASYVQTVEESKKLHGNHMPKVIISASGMAEGGRVLHHLVRYAPGPENTIVFVGFQAPGTRGDRILSGEREVKIHGAFVPIRARVALLESLSAHADAEEEIDWLRQFTSPPKTVFLTHGEKKQSNALKEKIVKELGWNVVIPKPFESFTLEASFVR